MTAAIDITAEQRKTLLALLRRFIPGVAVWAYGSRVKWTARPNSDLDLVAFTTPAQRGQVSELKEALDESNLPFLVDLHVWDEVPERFREIIRKEYVVLQETGSPENGSGMADAGWSAAPVGRVSPPGRNPTNDAQSSLPHGTTAPRGLPTPEHIYWPLVASSDLFGLRYGRALVESNRRPGRVPVYGTNGQCGTHDASLFKGPGVIIGRKGQGPLGVEWSEHDYWVIDTAYSLAPLRPDIDLRYAYFLIKFIGLNHLKDGTSNPTLSRDTFGVQALPLPPLNQQRAIAHILGTLDDKIELNRRMNETLEAMARALFKSWFVDFDPVRSKAAGRDPGLPQPLADLFPDSFEDSELGEIPRGWGVGALGDFLVQRVERCAASPETAARPYVPIDCISPKSLFLRESKPGEEAQSSLTKFYKGDILFGAMRPYFHKVCVAPFDGTTRTTAFVLYPRRVDDFGFATFQLHHPDTIDFASRHSTGSTIPYAVWTDSLDTMPVIAPSLEVRNAFNRLVRPILARVPEPYFANRTLATLRDALLPKLISGELRVKDAERFVGRVA